MLTGGSQQRGPLVNYGHYYAAVGGEGRVTLGCGYSCSSADPEHDISHQQQLHSCIVTRATNESFTIRAGIQLYVDKGPNFTFTY